MEIIENKELPLSIQNQISQMERLCGLHYNGGRTIDDYSEIQEWFDEMREYIKETRGDF